MSVMACERYRCGNIMCDRLITVAGNRERYICNRCFSQLEDAKNNWPSITSRDELLAKIYTFMEDTPPNENTDKGDRDIIFETLHRG